MTGESSERYRRRTSIRAFDQGSRTTVVGRDGVAHVFEGDSALLIRALLAALREPATFAELLARLEAVAAGVAEARPVIEQALGQLQAAGAITHEADRGPAEFLADRPRARLALGVSGAIAAANVPALISRLQARGFEVRVALTRAAARFVSPRALRALTHHPVARSLDGLRASAPVAFLDLAEWAELVLVAPASATTLARLAHGDCSDLVAAMALATRAPVILAPSMNAALIDAAPVARNLAQLAEDGFHVVHAALGAEVADAPDRRRPTFGSWPALDDLVALVEHVHAQHRAPGSHLAAGASTALWEGVYRDTPPEQLAFHTTVLDDDLREVLESVPRPASLWEIGCGLGTAAGAAAQMGFAVTASDLSPRAIALAQQRVQGVTWAVDDVRQSAIAGSFDVVLDRGCFHTLAPSDAVRCVEAVTRRTRVGSRVVLKLHREDEPGRWLTARYRSADLERLWGAPFELIQWRESSLPGAQGSAQAWLAVLRRRT